MIHVEDDGIGVKVHIDGKGITLLKEFSVLCADMIDNGLPLEILEASMLASQMFINDKEEKAEDEKLADEFMEELMKRVKEKHDAKQKN